MFVIIVLGSVPTLKPLYDRFLQSPKPYTSKQSFQHDDPESSVRGGGAKMGNLTRSQRQYGQDDLWDDTEADDEVRLNNITVHQTFGVQQERGKHTWPAQRTEEAGTRPVIGRNLV